jgi:NAD(P)-dependent dehydrogenase (short-subunit alcohol dehydrogenase family)
MAASPLALVTGANRGIGRAVAESLARDGHRVILAGRAEADLAREASRLGALGLEATPLTLDLGSAASIEAAAVSLLAGPVIDVLVQNAGVYGRDQDRGAARQTLAINLVGPIRLAAALVPHLADGARVVLVSSGLGTLSELPTRWRREVEQASTDDELLALAERFVAAQEARREDGSASLAYGISKALLNRLARRLAGALAPRGIRVNAVSPGWVKTDMGGPGAPRSIEEGARSILWATSLTAGGPSGGFFQDGEAIPF